MKVVERAPPDFDRVRDVDVGLRATGVRELIALSRDTCKTPHALWACGRYSTDDGSVGRAPERRSQDPPPTHHPLVLIPLSAAVWIPVWLSNLALISATGGLLRRRGTSSGRSIGRVPSASPRRQPLSGTLPALEPRADISHERGGTGGTEGQRPCLPKLSFSPLSGGRVKPRTAIDAISTHGTIRLEK